MFRKSLKSSRYIHVRDTYVRSNRAWSIFIAVFKYIEIFSSISLSCTVCNKIFVCNDHSKIVWLRQIACCRNHAWLTLQTIIKIRVSQPDLSAPLGGHGAVLRGPRSGSPGATERFSGGHEQRPLPNSSAVILQNPNDEQGATSVESLWKGAFSMSHTVLWQDTLQWNESLFKDFG